MSFSSLPSVTQAYLARRYATIGAILMSKKVVDGVRDKGGFWKHGHTYQVWFFPLECPQIFLRWIVGASDLLCCVFGCSKGHQGRQTYRAVPRSRRISLFFADRTFTGTQLYHCAGDVRHPRRRVRSYFSPVGS